MEIFFSKLLSMQNAVSRRLIVLVFVAAAVSAVFIAFHSGLLHQPSFLQSKPSFLSSSRRSHSSLSSTHRKLVEQGEGAGTEPERVGVGDKCTLSDLVVSQGPTEPLPSGIPTYTVNILNVCESGCAIKDIHLRCGWFSSARTINPAIFKRLKYDDCLVNAGGPIANGGSVSFQYANTLEYPLSVSSLSCFSAP